MFIQQPHTVLVSPPQLTSGTFIPKCLRKKLPPSPLQTQVRHVGRQLEGEGTLGSPHTFLALSLQGSALKPAFSA